MRHRKDRRKLNRNSSHRKATLKALMRAILKQDQIKTTVPKAKELRREIEPLITMAAKDSVHNRRLAVARCGDKVILDKLFLELGPRYADRPGGYTRIVKAGFRKGDSAPMAYIQFVGYADEEQESFKPKAKAAKTLENKIEETLVPESAASSQQPQEVEEASEVTEVAASDTATKQEAPETESVTIETDSSQTKD